MASDGSIEFSTRLDNAQLEKDLRAAEKKIDSLKQKIEAKESEKSSIEKQMEEADKAIEATKANIEALKARLNELKEDGAPHPGAIEVVNDELAAQQKALGVAMDGKTALIDKWMAADDAVEGYTKQLESAEKTQKELAASAKGIYTTRDGEKYASRMQAMHATAAKSIKAVHARTAVAVKSVYSKAALVIRQALTTALPIATLLGGLVLLIAKIKEVAMENERVSNAVQTLNAACMGFAQGIANVLAPAVLGFVRVALSMLLALARLIDSIFKTDFANTIMSRIASASSAATQSQEKQAKSTNKQAKSAGNLEKAVKKANRQLLAFDELNMLAADTADDAADNMDDQAAGMEEPEAPVIEEPEATGGFDPSEMLTGIDAALAQIMIIAGAALLAVGLILALSGVNIPLGLALMAIGALMIYTAVTEQWDQMPQEMKDAINTALILTGIALLVIGAILTFTAANIPLGIAMMVAGAALLFTAAVINWDELPEEMKTTLTSLMVIVGSAAIVIGAILALSGANIPLGVALMIVGAMSLAAAAYLNWEELPDEIKETVAIIAAVVGVAFLTIGAILAFSGANIPLGIALIAVGAAAIVSAAVLAWNELPDHVKQTVSTILAIVGVALLVIGIILCVTGVGIPIGIACILAGVVSLVSAVAINWDFLKDKIKEIWDGVVRWFNVNVAPIFTWQWWAEKFKAIANGLIHALNNALSGVGDFINSVAGGIADLLDFFGVEGWSFSITMPQIPYLAKGAVIPPNKKFMAVLGDQTSGYNLEAPEGLIRQIVREESASAFAELASMFQTGESGGDVNLVLMVDGEELARANARGTASLARRGVLNAEMIFA